VRTPRTARRLQWVLGRMATGGMLRAKGKSWRRSPPFKPLTGRDGRLHACLCKIALDDASRGFNDSARRVPAEMAARDGFDHPGKRDPL
ncbi:MAG: hypothetical protein O3A51_13155, partial [Verrucomicrobia bacterium]|nr:hypothetical protein [Verrucomicrobiota bacterium]